MQTFEPTFFSEKFFFPTYQVGPTEHFLWSKFSHENSVALDIGHYNYEVKKLILLTNKICLCFYEVTFLFTFCLTKSKQTFLFTLCCTKSKQKMICPIIKIRPIINPTPGGLLGAGLIGSSQGIILTHNKSPKVTSKGWAHRWLFLP